MNLYTFVCIFVLCFSSVFGQCLRDGNTAQPDSAWNQRLWSYSSKNPIQPSTSSDLKFITYNIQSGYHANCNNDPFAQANLMKGFDYTGTQETVQGVDTRCNSCNIPTIIADVAGMSTRYGMAMPYRTGQYGTAAGTTQEILDTKYTVMNYVGLEPRIVLALKTKPPGLNGRFLWFVNVHVEYYNGAARQWQIGQVLNFIRTEITNVDSSAMVVMVGDFNGGPWDAGYTTIKNFGFKNSWEVYSGSINGGNTISAFDPGSRFDHIWFYAPSDVVATVKACEVPNVLLSDHRPVTATINFRVSGSAPVATSAPVPTPPAASTVRPTSAPAAGNILVAKSSQWSYTTSAPGSTWNTLYFDDASWPVSSAPFVTGYAAYRGVGTPFGKNDYYFRSTFSIPSGKTVQSLKFSIASDNYALVYINGILVDSDPLTWHEAKYWNRVIDVQTSLLNSVGDNVIAVLVKNQDDWAFFDLELEATYGDSGDSIPAPTVVCVGPVLETQTFSLRCPLPTQKVTSIQFASYGNPTGSCGNFKLGTCMGGSSMAVMEDKCRGRNSCSFLISNDVFGDPCPRNGKHFYTQVTCN